MNYIEFLKTLSRRKIKTIGGNSSFRIKVLEDIEKVELTVSTGKKRLIKYSSMNSILSKQMKSNSYVTSDFMPAQNLSYHLALIKLYRK